MDVRNKNYANSIRYILAISWATKWIKRCEHWFSTTLDAYVICIMILVIRLLENIGASSNQRNKETGEKWLTEHKKKKVENCS